jgi:hypothetical protein
VVWAKPVYGFAVTNTIHFDGAEHGINNVFDASIAAQSIAKVYHKVSFKGLMELVSNNIKTLIRRGKYKKESLPQI